MSENRTPEPRLNRRQLLQGTVAAGLASGLALPGTAAAAQRRNPDLVPAENSKTGATDWQLTRVRLDKTGGYRSPAIEGYCSRQSATAGETVRIMVSTRPAARFTIEIFRMGYYGGRGARLMTTLGPLEGRPQPDPEVGPDRLRECRWEPSAELKIPDDWPSGVYLGRLSRVPEDGVKMPWQSYVVFIVRDDRPADVLFQCSDNTWQAYNRWPDRFSLYDDGSERDWYTGPGVDVSFDRPYGKYRQIYENPQSVGSGEFLCWEFSLCYWLEQHGYDVTYCSNSDRFELTGPDEGLLMGARNVDPVNGGGDWIVARPDHWIFEGTGMKKGDRIPGLVGWEFHGAPAELPGLEIVAEGLALSGGTRPQRWTATVHPGPKGNFVFNAATIFWSQGLSAPPGHMLPWSHWTRPHGPDERVQRTTRNLLERTIA